MLEFCFEKFIISNSLEYTDWSPDRSGHAFEPHYLLFSRSGFTKPAREGPGNSMQCW